MKIERLHHVAIICSDLEKSIQFYTDIFGFKIVSKLYRKEKDSYKVDLSLNGQYLIELFSFPNPPKRQSDPEATGLRHISFGVKDIESAKEFFVAKNIITEPMRIDENTDKRFFFVNDPDELPIELYEL